MSYDNGIQLSIQALTQEKDPLVLHQQCTHGLLALQNDPQDHKAQQFFDTALYFYAHRFFEAKNLIPEEIPELDAILHGNGKSQAGTIPNIKRKVASGEPIHSGYIYRALKNAYVDYIRIKARTPVKMQSLDDPVGNDLTLGDTLEANCVQPDRAFSSEGFIHKHLQKLPENLRAAMELHMDGFKYREIAETLDIPINTAKTNIFQARIRLQKSLLRSGELDANLASLMGGDTSPGR